MESVLYRKKDYSLWDEKRIELKKNLTFVQKKLIFNSDYEEKFEFNKSFISIYFCFSGIEFGEPAAKINDYNIRDGKCGFFLGQKGFKGTSKIPCKEPFQIMAFHLIPEELKKIAGESYSFFPEDFRNMVEKGDSYYFNKSMDMTSLMKLSLSQLINCNFDEKNKNLYFEAKFLELTSCLLELLKEKKVKKEVFSKKEIFAVHEVREIIIKDLINPPSLSELANDVGVHHTKLNKAFKQIYGKTIFSYLCDIRMEKARAYLERGDMNCTEAAMAVGYSSLSHFAKSFKEKYNVIPSACIQKKFSVKIG